MTSLPLVPSIMVPVTRRPFTVQAVRHGWALKPTEPTPVWTQGWAGSDLVS